MGLFDNLVKNISNFASNAVNNIGSSFSNYSEPSYSQPAPAVSNFVSDAVNNFTSNF